MHTWSPYQSAIFDFVRSPPGEKRNAVIKAVAGSGKTTTLVECVKLAKGSSIFLAFNKSIATELGRRGVNARTFHSLTYSPVMRFMRQRTVTDRKLEAIIDDNFREEDVRLYGVFCKKLVALAKGTGIGCLVPDEPEQWEALVDHHNLELEKEGAKMPRAMQLASKLLELSNDANEVDFDDLLYIAVKDGISLGKFDNIFVDELQDTNQVQRAIVRKLMHTESRVFGVGDPAQAIYGFRGADSNSMDLFVSDFNAVELPLTVSYRCPKAVVEYAKTWVEHIQAAPNAADGIVVKLEDKWSPATFQSGDLVVCRTTAPLIETAYKLIRAKVPARIMGRDIGKNLTALVKKMATEDLDELLEKLSVYTSKEAEKAVAKKQDTKAEAIIDKSNCIKAIVEGLPETETNVSALYAAIDELFADRDAAIVLATIHKAKGLEAERVFWLNSSKCPSRWARQDWQIQQEKNLCYVATTRAMKELYLIESEPPKA